MTYIIAEAGTGHFDLHPGERLMRAQEFILSAARAGANAVKFQMFIPNEPLFCPMPGDDLRQHRWDETALDLEHWKVLQGIASRNQIDLLWSAFQPTCIEWLKELKPRYVKVASRARETFPYWGGPEFIISAAEHARTDSANVHFLKCVPKYPAPLEECGFPTTWTKADFCGLSDHSGTIWPGLDAIYHGAKFLEVHVKLPGCDMGNDEPVCLTMEQLKLLTEARDAVARMHPDRV